MTTQPYDGEQVGPFVYNARYNHWRYAAGYVDDVSCMRRAEHLHRVYGLYLVVQDFDGEWWIYVTPDQTGDLRAAVSAGRL